MVTRNRPTVKTVSRAVVQQVPGCDFDRIADQVRVRFASTQREYAHLFTTDPDEDLWDVYLRNLPNQKSIEHHNCNACKQFIRQFGGLVCTDGKNQYSALWSDHADMPLEYQRSVLAMAEQVELAPITGVFLSEKTEYGRFVTGEWSHFALEPVSSSVYRRTDPKRTAHVVMADKREDHKNLLKGMSQFETSHIELAITLLKAETLANWQAVLPLAEFLHRVKTQVERATTEEAKDLVVWHAVAGVPRGWCVPQNTMIGSLLKDLMDGMSVRDASARFSSKMGPTRYQRPTEAPRQGAVAEANRLFADMGLERSLERRFARLDELKLLWSPARGRERAKTTGGVFDDVPTRAQPSGVDPVAEAHNLLNPARVTWAKFARDVLPEATHLRVRIGHGLQNFGAMVTAVHADAPPILMWDHEMDRNPVNSYVYAEGSMPSAWHLHAGDMVEVTGVSLMPYMWDGQPRKHLGEAVMLVLRDCRARDLDGGLALFPQVCRQELYAVRGVIESFSNRGRLRGQAEATACGLVVGNNNANVVVATTTMGSTAYIIDRWE